MKRNRGIKKLKIILNVGVKKTSKKASLQGNTDVGVLLYVYNFFEKYSVQETFLEILKKFSEKLSFRIYVDEHFGNFLEIFGFTIVFACIKRPSHHMCTFNCATLLLILLSKSL